MTEETNNEQTKEKIQTIGEYLRAHREKSGHTLKYISNKTKISLSQLESLENDKLDRLPDKTYVQGFIKAFCKYVEMDNNEAIKRLHETYEELFPDRQPADLKVLTPKETNSPSPIMVAGVVGVIIFAIGYGLFNYFKNQSLEKIRTELQKPIKTRTLTSKTPLIEETELKEEKIEVPVEKEAVPVVKKEEPKVEVAPVVKKEEPKVEVAAVVKKEDPPKKEEEKKEDVKFYSISNLMYSKETKDADKLIAEHLPSSVIKANQEGSQNVFIKATNGDTWITYKKDFGPVRKFILKKDKTLFLSGSLIRIFLGNVHATKIFLNNEPLKIESNSGVKSLIFPQTERKKYKLPLFIFKDSGEVITSEEYLEEKA